MQQLFVNPLLDDLVFEPLILCLRINGYLCLNVLRVPYGAIRDQENTLDLVILFVNDLVSLASHSLGVVLKLLKFIGRQSLEELIQLQNFELFLHLHDCCLLQHFIVLAGIHISQVTLTMHINRERIWLHEILVVNEGSLLGDASHMSIQVANCKIKNLVDLLESVVELIANSDMGLLHNLLAKASHRFDRILSNGLQKICIISLQRLR